MILHGDCLEKLRDLADNSVDAIVTDPPYGLSFMGKRWDYDVPSTDIWKEALRVLKPGGHLLAFFGTRTYHRGVVRIEDAGFEIRDQIQWLYGSGFPKSHDISKAIDKAAGAERGIIGTKEGMTNLGSLHDDNWESEGKVLNVTAPATDLAKQWQGWGTALKPANEPIVVARKPLEKGLTIAENVQKWGTGAINIDGSRIEAADQAVLDAAVKRMTGNEAVGWKNTSTNGVQPKSAQGRWPANVIFDEIAAEMLDEQSIGYGRSSGNKSEKIISDENSASNIFGKNAHIKPGLNTYCDSGGASRFFYVAKASKSERNKGLEGMPAVEKRTMNDFGDQSKHMSTDGVKRTKGTGTSQNQNHHPTVKPIKLMQYLIKLVTPPGGIVLDPFMGSGSTGVAAKALGFEFIGIEMNEEYVRIAEKRIEASA